MTHFEDNTLPLYEARRTAWLKRARDAARVLGANGRSVTIEDLRRVCEPTPGDDPRVMGAVFLRTEWENCGYVKGSRAESHGRPIAEFKLRK